jgi:hypothetical protein
LKRLLVLAALSSSAVAGAQDSGAGRAVVGVARERMDDLHWENDRTAYRIYSRKLEAAEPPSSSGIDVWAKRAPGPFMAASLRGGAYHEASAAGADFFHVGTSRGLGGLGIWHDNKLWTSRNYERPRIIESGPRRARFEVDYGAWPVGVERKVWETRRFELANGDRFTRLVSTIHSDRPEPLLVGIGVTRGGVAPADGAELTVDRAAGRITLWTAKDPRHGAMGLALLVDPRQISGVARDSENHLVLLKVQPGRPFVYHIGSVWERAGQIRTAEEWRAAVAAERPSFRP